MHEIITLSIAALLGLIPAYIAEQKGHSFGKWWIYGWLLFIVAIIHVQSIEDYTRTESETTKQTPSTLTESTSSVVSASEELKKYKKLHDNGVITEEDFEARKKKLLGM